MVFSGARILLKALDIRWFSAEELGGKEITPNVRILAKKAIEMAGKWS